MGKAKRKLEEDIMGLGVEPMRHVLEDAVQESVCLGFTAQCDLGFEYKGPYPQPEYTVCTRIALSRV
eukprot:1106532-Rhodomonas_salina.1